MKKLFTKVDIIIIFVVLIIGTCLLLLKPSEKGKTAIIRVDGKEYKTIDLTKNENLNITVNGVNIISSEGEIFVNSSSCPDKICVNAGHLSKKGQTSVCVPNRVSIEIVGNSKVQVVTG